MKRRLIPTVFAILCLLPAMPAWATIGPSIKVRWDGDWPAPAIRGAEVLGRFELESGGAVIIENLRVEGSGWTVEALDAPRSIVMPARSKRRFTFRAVPGDPRAPLEIRGSANGIPFGKRFRLDEESRAKGGKLGGARSDRAAVAGPKSGGGATIQGGTIRFRGRFAYPRPDNLLVGADNVEIRIFDKDVLPFGDEEIARFNTDAAGYFDYTATWNDVDPSGPDQPDIYVEIHPTNPVATIRRDEGFQVPYGWTTLGYLTYPDYAGSDLDFGTIQPLEFIPAAHIYTSIIKAHRHANGEGGMPASHVFVNWPETDGRTYYSQGLNEVYISSDEEWVEGTHVHEYGHKLSDQFSVNQPASYENGFCDTPAPSHCVWCPENDGDAWGEGWANWFASRMLRVWEGAYGVEPFSINDNRYDLESTQSCQQDNQDYFGSSTEGVIGALLRDIEDGENENQSSSGPFDCSADMLNQGDEIIFLIFRDADPATVGDFIQSFRQRAPYQDRNLWATIENVAPAINFAKPALAMTSQPPSCRIHRVGETIQLTAGANGGILSYRWLRNGIPLSNAPGVSGAFTSTLTLGPLSPALAGDYACRVYDCNGVDIVVSSATEVRVEAAPFAGPFLSWGVNTGGQVGDGSASSTTRPPFTHPGLTDIAAVDGGVHYTMALRGNGQLLTWGSCQSGELGQGIWSGSSYNPTPILENIAGIAAGKGYGLALERDGRIKAWGNNFYGQLFTGTRDGHHTPVSALDLGCVKALAGADSHSLALLEDGTVRAIGYNGTGAVGNGATNTFELTPQTPVGLTDVIAIDAGGFWSMALRADGTVWTWGINTWGQLGLGHTSTVLTPTQVPGLTGIARICATNDNAYALKLDGTLYAWGYGPAVGIGWTGGGAVSPQLVPLANVTKVQGNASWVMALAGGQLKGWGLNAGVNPGEGGVFNLQTSYVVPSPIDVPQVQNIADFGAGWTSAHAFGSVGLVDVPGTPAASPAVLALAIGPNPARDAASVRFDLPAAGAVTLAVYDVAGRAVRTLANGEVFEPGRHARTWDGLSNAGGRVPAGVYFVRMIAPGGALTKTLVRVN